MHVFSTWEGLLQGWQCNAWIKIVSINAGRWNANTIKSVWPIQQSSAQMPISLLLIMCLMRNHSVGESPNLCKHCTVSIDLFGGDMSLLGLARRLFLPFYKGWPGKDTQSGGALEAVTAITIQISYWGQVMRTDRLGDGSISDIDTRRGRTNCDISFLSHVQRSSWDNCVSVLWALCVSVCVWGYWRMCVCERGPKRSQNTKGASVALTVTV